MIKILRIERMKKMGPPWSLLDEMRKCATAETDTEMTVDLNSECYKALYEHHTQKKAVAYREMPPYKPRLRDGPGSTVKIILAAIGVVVVDGKLICPNGTQISNCGCNSFAAKMDRWGWKGLHKNRKEIYSWFKAKANDCNLKVSLPTLIVLLTRAVSEMRARRKAKES